MALSEKAAAGCWEIGIFLGFAAGLITRHFNHDLALDVGVGIVACVVSSAFLGALISLDD